MRSGGSCRSRECASDTERVKPAICEQFGIDFPLFAFSHCRDVVAAVTNAGVSGCSAARPSPPNSSTRNCRGSTTRWTDKPYGADLIVPAKFEGKGEKVTSSDLAARIPDEVRGFVAELFAAHDIESDPKPFIGGSSLAGTTGRELLDVGDEPPDQADRQRAWRAAAAYDRHGQEARHSGRRARRRQGACGNAGGGGRGHRRRAGTEAGGHCGEVTTMVLVPEVIEALRARVRRCSPRAASSPAADGGGDRDGRGRRLVAARCG